MDPPNQKDLQRKERTKRIRILRDYTHIMPVAENLTTVANQPSTHSVCAATMKALFMECVHDPDSAVVHAKIQEGWKKLGKAANLMVHFPVGKASVSVVSCLKYLSRRHGLPQPVVKYLLSKLCSITDKNPEVSSDVYLNQQIAQCLKYCLQQDPAVINAKELVTACSTVLDADATDAFRDLPLHTRELVSQLMQCIILKISACSSGNEADRDGLVKLAFKYASAVNADTKLQFQETLQAHGISVSVGGKKPSAAAPIDIVSENSSWSSERLLASGQEMLRQCVNSGKSAVKADAVKTQQTVTTVYKENMSEKTELQRIDLAKALNSSRASNRGTAQKMEINPALISKGSSVRSYFRSTAQEIDNLLARAQANMAVCQDDIVYLKDKFCYGYVGNFWEGRMTTFANIALAFSLIAKNQVVDDATQLELAKSTFEASLDRGYDDCRLKFLKMYHLCAERSNGKLPEKVLKILLNFQTKSSECTRDMKKMLWVILKKDDNNMQESFAVALDIVKLATGEQDEVTQHSIEYIWEQVVHPGRALNLEKSLSFSSTLVDILTGQNKGHYGLKTAASVAAVLNDLMAHAHEKLPRAISESIQSLLTTVEQASTLYSHWNRKDSEAIQKLYVQSIIGITLKTLSHPKFNVSDRNSKETIRMLVQHALYLETDRQLAANIIVVVGNLVIAKKVSLIPGVERLASRLKFNDAIDEDGVIRLNADHNTKAVGLQYVTAVISEMLLQLIFLPKNSLNSSVPLDEILAAIHSSPDKNTQIRCAECVFHAAINRYSFLTDKHLWPLLALTTSAVTDVRINCTAAYCLLLERVTFSERKQTLTAGALTDLALMFSFEPVLLSGRDFTMEINASVLKVVLNSASNVQFTETVHQQLSTILMAEEAPHAKAHQEIVVRILYAQVQSPVVQRALPVYCLNAVENMILNDNQHFEICANILFVISQKFYQCINPAVLAILQQRFDTEQRCERLGFWLTFSAVCVQDVSEHAFCRFDLEFATARILAAHSSSASFGFSELLDQRTKNGLFEILKRYFQAGFTMSMLNKRFFELCIIKSVNVEIILECLLLVCENGQILPHEIIDRVFDNKTAKLQMPVIQLRLASAIVQNNQSIPEAFTQKIVKDFCSGSFPNLFRNFENCAKFSIITKLMNNNFEVPDTHDVTAKLCEGWKKESGGNHRQKLDILSALASQANSASAAWKIDPERLKAVFVEAMSSDNAQMIETALNGFISLSRYNSPVKAALHDEKDFKLLIKLQRSASSTGSLKETVSEYLTSMHKILPASVKASLNLSHLENKTNVEMLTDLPMLCRLDDFEFFESQDCQARMQKIFENDTDPKVLNAALAIVKSYPRLSRLPEKTLEAVGFAKLSTNNQKVSDTCESVIVAGLNHGIKPTENLKAYISTDRQSIGASSVFANEFDSHRKSSKLYKLLNAEIAADVLTTMLHEISQIDLDERTLTALLEKDFSRFTILAEYLAGKVSTSQIFDALDKNCELRTRIMEIFCDKIRTHGESISDTLLEALKTVLSLHEQPVIMSPDEFVQVFADSLISETTSIVKVRLIVQCLVALMKSASCNAPETLLQPRVLGYLVMLLQHPSCLVRRQCVLGLDIVYSMAVVALVGDTEITAGFSPVVAGFKTFFGSICTHAFQRIFANCGDGEVVHQLAFDTNFNEGFAKFLLCLTHWDFEIIKPIRLNRMQWRQQMLISDFLVNFVDSFDLAVDIHQHVTIIANKFHVDEEREEFFDYLTLVCSSVEKLSLQRILFGLTILDAPELKECQQTSKGDFERQTAEQFILKLLAAKITFTQSTQILGLLTQQLMSAFGIDVAAVICTDCGKINSMQEFTAFFDYFKGANIQNLIEKKYFFRQNNPGTKRLQEIAVQLGTELLMQNIPDNTIHRKRLERVIGELCQGAVSLCDLQQLLAFCSATNPNLKSFEHAIGQAHQYNLSGASFTALRQAVSIARTESEIVAVVNTFTREKVFEGKHGVKQVAHIVGEFRRNNTRVSYKWICLRERFMKAGYEWDILQLHIFRIFDADLRSRVYKSDMLVSTWTATDITHWAQRAVARRHEYRPAEFVTEALAIARLAMENFKNFVLTKVQILSCLVALDKLKKDTTKGQLQQVATGSGKSAIVAVLAAVKALEGHTVDIYTSSPVLAERDAQEWTQFYQLFGLTCGHNGDKGVYVAKKKPCYDQRIVYGECAQFQFDYLRDKYSGLGTLGGRTTDFAIVDEVDSALIDDSAKLARLSTTLPGMDTLHVLYCLIWDRLTHVQSHLFSVGEHQFYVEGRITVDEISGTFTYQFANSNGELLIIHDLVRFIFEASSAALVTAQIFEINELETFLKSHMTQHIQSVLESKSLCLQFPANIADFARNQIPLWVESALTAIKYQENVHYIVDEGQIKPVDYATTGVVQSSTNWNNGLHQFLQLKHSLKIHSETVTTNFLSNYSMFNKYGTNIIGFTGTLGSSYEREIMYNIYHVKLLVLPETYFKRYTQFPDICVENEEQWLREIAVTTLAETSKKRAVLVICETIKSAHLIGSVFSSFKVKVKLYVKNQEGQEKQIERLHPGDIVVATNLAGRGTDLKTAEIEEYGGLHVCLTFLPRSLRTEEQAFGRTSRQGNKGTGQLIIVGDPLSNYRKQRDLEEKRMLEEFRQHELPYIQMKGKLFEEFCEFYNSVRRQLQSQRSFWKNMGNEAKDVAHAYLSIGSGSASSFFETIVLLSVEEQWAKFLLRVDRENFHSKKAHSEFRNFKAKLEKTENKQELIKAANNAFYFVQLGNVEYISEKYPAAVEHYNIAIQMDLSFAFGAQIGLAAAYLNTGEPLDYKRKAVEKLNSVLHLLYREMSVINTMQVLTQKQLPPGSSNDTPLFQQLIQKTNLLGYFINSIQANIDATERSLRKVNLDYLTESDRRTLRLPNDLLQKNPKERCLGENLKQFKEFSLTFHDQTVHNDSGEKDQALQTLPGTAATLLMSSLRVSLCCEAVDLLKLGDLLKPDIKLFKKVPEISVEVLKIHRDFEKGGKLSFQFNDIRDMGVSNFDLEISGPLKTLIKATKNLIKKSKTFQHQTIIVTTDEHRLIKKFLPFEMAERVKLDVFKQLEDNCIYVRVIGLLRAADVHHAVESLGKDCHPAAPELHINLTLRGLHKRAQNESVKRESEPYAEVLKTAWSKAISSYSANLVLSEISPDSAKDVIRVLRKYNVRFTMQLYNLSWGDANKILKDAKVDQEQMHQTKVQELSDMFTHGQLPLQEIRELSARGLSMLVSFNEKQFLPWISLLSVCGLAFVQAAAGGLLITTTFGASLGMSLVTEAMSDMTMAHRIYATRSFDWSDYVTQKAVSLVITTSTMGLNSLSNGAKGIKLLTTKAAASGSTVAAANTAIIKATGANLKVLAVKHIAVRTAETGARIGIKALSDKLSGFCFEQIREAITREVEQRVEQGFSHPNFKIILAETWAQHRILDAGTPTSTTALTLQRKLERLVKATMNPQLPAWRAWWNSVGAPLANGILSDPRFTGTAYSNLVMCWGALSGVHEVTTIISKVFTELAIKLHEDVEVFRQILRQNDFSAEAISKITRNTNITFKDVSAVLAGKEGEALQKLLKTLSEEQKQFDTALVKVEMSVLHKAVTDLIVSHIIKTANSHLVSPVMSQAAGAIVRGISEELQKRFVVSEAQDSRDPKFLDRTRTVKGQIEMNAKEYMINFQLRDMIVKTEAAIERAEKNGIIDGATNDPEVKKLAADIADNKPIDNPTFLLLAKLHNLNLKIVESPSYVPTEAERASGVRIVVYIPPPRGAINGVGHYALKNADADGYEIEETGAETYNSQNNCGYNIISRLAKNNPSASDLRLQAVRMILADPQTTRDILCIHKWFEDNFAQEATHFLGIAGVRAPDQLTPSEKKGKGNGIIYVLQPLDEDGDLASMLQRLKVAALLIYLSTALRYSLDIAEGTRFLYENGISHADIKPANILVEKLDEDRKRLLIGDLDDRLEMHQDTTGDITHIRGTARYMSPEMLKKFATHPGEKIGQESPGRKTDIWSLGFTHIDSALRCGLRVVYLGYRSMNTGPMFASRPPVTLMKYFDTVTDEWDEWPNDQRDSLTETDFQAAVVDKVYMLSGTSSFWFFWSTDSSQCVDLSKQTIQKICALPKAKEYLCAFALNNRIYMWSGASTKDNSYDTYVYDAQKDKWDTEVFHVLDSILALCGVECVSVVTFALLHYEPVPKSLCAKGFDHAAPIRRKCFIFSGDKYSQLHPRDHCPSWEPYRVPQPSVQTVAAHPVPVPPSALPCNPYPALSLIGHVTRYCGYEFNCVFCLESVPTQQSATISAGEFRNHLKQSRYCYGKNLQFLRAMFDKGAEEAEEPLTNEQVKRQLVCLLCKATRQTSRYSLDINTTCSDTMLGSVQFSSH
ncbi:uncharacterized protein LOC129592727 [Paramacrobiotus metropolitanus]|uniref:uncharacterized protein LOC129592727 n=1 Tax=Paramacrobiotus metropolitanus TaxID=2943436 RepID=UPI0024462972|nr:uncharacterized protein LOC129592727 [Paramacrobiotus metropolitanus]